MPDDPQRRPSGPTAFDMHSDVPVDVFRRRRAGERGVLAGVHLPRWRQGRVGGAVLIVGGDGASLNPLGAGLPIQSTLHVLDAVLLDMAETPDAFQLVTSAADLAEARRSGRFAVVLGIEGAQPIGEDLAVLRNLYRLGLRLVGLTWNYRNAVAAGVGEGPRAGGLSRFGAAVIEEMNRLGMLIDVSHLADPGVRDVLEVSTRPILASHSNSRALRNHPRNLPDDLIRRIAEKGGVVGAVFYPGFVGERPTLADVGRHVLYLLDVAGEDHVGLGPDFIDFALDLIVSNLKAAPVDYGDSFAFPAGLEDTTRVGALLDHLAAVGLPERVVEKIAWGNFARLLGEVVG